MDETKVALAEKPATSSGSKRPLPLLVAGGVAFFVVVALGLGLGLGLGLKHKASNFTNPPAPTGSPLPGTGNGSRTLESWQLDTSQYVLDLNWDLNAAPTTRHYDFVISEGQGWPDGVLRDMIFINGKFPGPLIEINRGDTLVVNVTNNLSQNQTTMHWHGIYQNRTNWYDGPDGITQCGIPAGQSLVYNFAVNNQYGTFWYHSHYSTQYLDGILGPLIVHAPEEADSRKLYDRDQILLVQDWYHDLSPVNSAKYIVPGNENTEPVPDNGLINGVNYFNCSNYDSDSGYTCFDNSTYFILQVPTSSRTRLRLINTGAFAEFEFSIDNHTISVIEADSTATNPLEVHRVPIHVAQRYSVVLNANQSSGTNYWVRAHMNTFCMASNPVLDPTVHAVLVYEDSGSAAGKNATAPVESIDWGDAVAVVCKDLDAGQLVPLVAMQPPPATRMWRIDFSFGIGAYQLDHAKVNGTTWAPLENTTTLLETVNGLGAGAAGNDAAAFGAAGVVSAFPGNQFVLGVAPNGTEVVDILFYSLDEGAHPFHLHGHQFWILYTGSGPFDWGYYYSQIYPSGAAVANPLRRDTLTVQSYGWSLIRFVADNPGLWALHCHIAWHMEAGLMMQVLSRPDLLATLTVPEDVRGLCPSSA